MILKRNEWEGEIKCGASEIERKYLICLSIKCVQCKDKKYDIEIEYRILVIGEKSEREKTDLIFDRECY
jgi:hypothetical protein